jgi:hypothetical protein
MFNRKLVVDKNTKTDRMDPGWSNGNAGLTNQRNTRKGCAGEKPEKNLIIINHQPTDF